MLHPESRANGEETRWASTVQARVGCPIAAIHAVQISTTGCRGHVTRLDTPASSIRRCIFRLGVDEGEVPVAAQLLGAELCQQAEAADVAEG